MKRTVKVVILGALLQGSAQAGELDAADKASQDKKQEKLAIAQQETAAGKKTKPTRNNKANTKSKADPAAKEKQDAVTETPSDSAEQSVLLRGIRG